MQKSALIIKKSYSGKGVFANKNLKKGKAAFVFSDKTVKIEHKRGCDCRLCRRCIQIGEHEWLSPKKGSFGWYLNHSCTPSCGIKGKRIVALRNLKKDEEITIDYSTTNTDIDWKMSCSCKQKNCRKIIRSVQFMPYKRFLKFRFLMPKYVAREYIREQKK